MKGITHFVSGVAAASFFPWAVTAAENGNPLYFILGGAMGLLPDTLDFKFYRFFYRYDIEIQPDPRRPDLRTVAAEIAGAIDRARHESRPVRLKLHTLRLGADWWRQYEIRFDAENRRVHVRLGPIVNTGLQPAPDGEPDPPIEADAPLPCPLIQDYDTVINVDIFDGPSFSLEQQGRAVRIKFLPWHREWTHSLTLAAALSAAGGLAWGRHAGIVMMAGATVHILEDQLGLMGSNLLYPFTRRRTPGLHLMRSVDAGPNFATVWLCLTVIFWNLYRRIPVPSFEISFLELVFFAVLLPLGAYHLLLRVFGLFATGRKP